MNVEKIQKLSEQHKALKAFYGGCCHNNVNLCVEGPAICSTTLNQATTNLVITELRTILLREIGKLEETIKKEATNG